MQGNDVKLSEMIRNGRKLQGDEMYGSEMKLKNMHRNQRKEKKMKRN